MTGVPLWSTISITPTDVAIAGEIDAHSVPTVESGLLEQTGLHVTSISQASMSSIRGDGAS